MALPAAQGHQGLFWKAYDRMTKRLINWECGNRDEPTFRRLFERLTR
jgi:insertion element IS1 protein InsB